MVVEEVETPAESKKEVEKEKEPAEPQILDEAAKVSSQELASNENVQLNPEHTPETKKNSSLILWILIPGIFLLGAILGGIVFYQKGVNKGQEAPVSPTPTPVVSATPSASPSATIDLTKYRITVFNGSGIAGEAGRVKTLLTTAGFKVGSTTNAASYDYTKTIIKAKSSVETSFISALSDALGKTYDVDTPQSLDASSADTVQVIVGSSKATP